MTVITLTTDFGIGSPYVAAMKGVILSIAPQASIVDVSHSIPPQDIRTGALTLADATPWFSDDTVHVAVVDPGVGTQRDLIYARIGRAQYLAPDNGLLSLLAGKWPPERIIRLERTEHWLPNVSSTFHGRDILAPIAARLTLGLDPNALGPIQPDLIRLNWPAPTVESRRITGEILAVDSFGNLITNIRDDYLLKVPRNKATVACSGHAAKGIVAAYGQRPPGELIALISSSGRLELAVVNGNAAATLSARIGAPIEITW